MKIRPDLLLFAPAMLAVVLSGPARAITPAEAATGRKLLAAYSGTIINVEVVTSIRLTVGTTALPPQEPRFEVNGTVISPAGLTITSLSAIDPRGGLENQLRAMGAAGQRVHIGEAEYKEAKLRLTDGTEVPARVVLKDPDLDIAFFAPLPGATGVPRQFACVKLDPAARPDLLGDYYAVSRAGRPLQRAPLVRLVTVEGTVDRPRAYYMVPGAFLGCPVFDARGQTLGIGLRHIFNGRMTAAEVIMPAVDVASEAQQAAVAAAKPPEAPADIDDGAAPAPTGKGSDQAPP